MQSTPSGSFLRKIAEGLIWSTGGAVILKALWFVAALAIIATLSLHQFGTYQLVLAAWAILLSFLLTNSDQVFVARGAALLSEQGEAAARALGLSTFLFRCGAVVLLWGLIVFGFDTVLHWYSGDILAHLKILSFALFTFPFSALVSYELSIRKKFFLLNVASVTEESIKVAGIFISLFLLSGGVAGLLWAYVIAAYCKTLFFLPVIMPYLRRVRNASVTPFIQILFSLGKWNIAQQYVRQVGENGRVFFIQFFIGREAVALFSLAQKLFSHISSLVPMRGFLIPLIASELQNQARLQHMLERGIKYSVPLFSAMAVGAAATAPFFLTFFFPQYVPALSLFYIMLAYMPLIGVSQLLLSFLFSNQEQKSLFFITLSRYVLMALTLPLALVWFGVIGVAVEFAVLSVVFIFVRYVTLVRLHPGLVIRLGRLWNIDTYDRDLWHKTRMRVFRQADTR